MRTCILGVLTGLAINHLSADPFGWEPSPGHTQVPIWPGAVPDAQPVTEPETATAVGERWYVAGRPWVAVRNSIRTVRKDHKSFGKLSRMTTKVTMSDLLKDKFERVTPKDPEVRGYNRLP
jgi:hypothetical protein